MSLSAISDVKTPGKLHEKQVRNAIGTWLKDLPPLEGLDPDVIIARGPRGRSVFIAKTMGPTGMLLEPPWSKVSRATGGEHRAEILGGIRLTNEPV